MSLLTPVRTGRELGATLDMNNESPLPTPPQAMHELIRHGRVAAAVSAATRSSLQGRQQFLEQQQHEHLGYAEEVADRQSSSSPSTRAAAASSSSRPALGRTSSISANRSPPTSLAVSMGALSSSSHHPHQHQLHSRSMLGSQMGILQASAYHNSSNNGNGPAPTSPSEGTAPKKLSRPGALSSNAQRSVSYEVSGTPKRAHEESNRMSTRPSYKSLATAASTEGSGAYSSRKRDLNDKENISMDGRNGASANVPRPSTHRRISARRSPSPPPPPPLSKSKAEEGHDGAEGSVYRRSSGEGEKQLPSTRSSIMAKSTDEGYLSSTRRRAREEPQERASMQQAHYSGVEEGPATNPSFLHVTPGLANGAKVLRSGYAPKQAATPWSVGRSIRRLDRHNAPDKPPQRMIASANEEDEDEEEEEKEREKDEHKEEEVNEKHRHQSPHLRIDREEDEELHDILRIRDQGMRQSSVRSPRSLHGGGSDGANRSPPLLVPLGADEDEEEEDDVQEQHRQSRLDQYQPHSDARRSVHTSSGESEAGSRRAAMQDILAARIPPVSNKRAVGEIGAQGLGISLSASRERERETPAAAVGSAADSRDLKLDFMAQVRREAARQRGNEHLERLSSKPSKDLETKFNGYKFKKIRKAGEGGFSTVWQVRGPFAAPDPNQPGQYIDVPESEQGYFAMKQVTLKKMEKISREEVLEECNLLQTLAGKKHNEDFILRFFGWKSSTGSLKILLELGEHDFNHVLREGRLTRQQIRQYWNQMLEAVHFTHEEGNIVHTDLKPANFLMANGRLKLIDFGIAQKIPVGTIHIKRDAMIGTPNYMAPETVKAVKEARREGRDARVYKAGKASDVWALGCILYQMVYNRPPFEAFHGDEKLKEILDPKHVIHYPPYRPAPYTRQHSGRHSGEVEKEDRDDDGHGEDDELDLKEAVEDDLIDVLKQTFIYNPQERITIPQLFEHPFLRPVRSSVPKVDREAEVVPISRAKLKEIIRRMYDYITETNELREEDLDQRGDAVFDNIRDKMLAAAAMGP